LTPAISFAQKITITGTVSYANGDSVTGAEIKFRPLKNKIKIKEPGKKHFKKVTVKKLNAVYNDTVIYKVMNLGDAFPFLTQQLEKGNTNIYKTGRRYFINKKDVQIFEFRRNHLKRLSNLFFKDNTLPAQQADTTKNIGVFLNAASNHNLSTPDTATSLIDELYHYKPKYILKFSVFNPEIAMEIKLNEFFTIQSGFGLEGYRDTDSTDADMLLSAHTGIKYYYNLEKRKNRMRPTYNFQGRYFMLSHQYIIHTANEDVSLVSLNHGWQFSSFYNGIGEISFGLG